MRPCNALWYWLIICWTENASRFNSGRIWYETRLDDVTFAKFLHNWLISTLLLYSNTIVSLKCVRAIEEEWFSVSQDLFSVMNLRLWQPEDSTEMVVFRDHHFHSKIEIDNVRCRNYVKSTNIGIVSGCYRPCEWNGMYMYSTSQGLQAHPPDCLLIAHICSCIKDTTVVSSYFLCLCCKCYKNEVNSYQLIAIKFNF